MAITIQEYNEARMYLSTEKVTNWQKGRIIILYVKAVHDFDLNRTDIPDDKIEESFNQAKVFFSHNYKLEIEQ